MTHDTTMQRLLLIVADGVRPEVLRDEVSSGRAPALAALAAHGALHTVTASFPSVTGPAYVPFLMGRHPASVGLPGLRWYDRSHALRWAFSPTRSYAGIDIWHVDRDLDPAVPTLLELAQPSLSGMSMLARGASHGRIGRSLAWMLRAAPVHFRGDLAGWQRVEQRATAAFLDRFAAVRPRVSVLAITSPDKYAHKYGPHSDQVRSSIADIDRAARDAQSVATRDGWRETLHVWVVGDHGHATVSRHDDLHGWLELQGLRVLAHPRLAVRRADVALMVGGNAMAHLYLEPMRGVRRWWPDYAPRWQSTLEALLARESVDLAAVALDASTVLVVHAERGTARITARTTASMTAANSTHAVAMGHHHGPSHHVQLDYEPLTGDPLGLGEPQRALDRSGAWHATATTAYPDSLLQLWLLATAPRSGDIILSASPQWDLRARYEPVAHVSTHGALLRDQMEVPLLVDMPTPRQPQRTADVMPSALDLLGIPAIQPWDGRSFLRHAD